MARYLHWTYGEISVGRLDRVVHLLDEDFEWVIAELETYRGREGFREGWRSFWNAFGAEIQLELREYIDAPGGRFVCLHTVEGAGITSGISTSELGRDYPMQCAFTMRDGMIVRCEAYGTRAEALEAAGLSD